MFVVYLVYIFRKSFVLVLVLVEMEYLLSAKLKKKVTKYCVMNYKTQTTDLGSTVATDVQQY